MVLAVLLTMLVITGEHSCGYWGANAVVCINRGALVIYHDPVYYEGWFWADLDFVPMEGLVMWPLFADRVTLVPLWMILIPLLVLDLWAWRRTADVQAGFCHKCRYNLRGVASEVCPECGTNVTK
jgi:hypothetical protein